MNRTTLHNFSCLGATDLNQDSSPGTSMLMIQNVRIFGGARSSWQSALRRRGVRAKGSSDSLPKLRRRGPERGVGGRRWFERGWHKSGAGAVFVWQVECSGTGGSNGGGFTRLSAGGSSGGIGGGSASERGRGGCGDSTRVRCGRGTLECWVTTAEAISATYGAVRTIPVAVWASRTASPWSGNKHSCAVLVGCGAVLGRQQRR